MRQCECGCGEWIPDENIHGQKRKWAYKHQQRSARKFKEPPEIVECDCGCKKTFPNRTKHGRPRRWFSSKCRYRTSIALSPKAQQNKRDREAVRRKKAVGRICEYCGKDDSDGKWGAGSIEACETCRRQMSNHKCGFCGGPFYIFKFKERPAGCVARCEGSRQ